MNSKAPYIKNTKIVNMEYSNYNRKEHFKVEYVF